MTGKRVTQRPVATMGDALRRVGTSNERNAKWLFAFLRHDAGQMNSDELLTAIQDVTAFAWLSSDISAKDISWLPMQSDLEMMTASINFHDGTGIHYLYPGQDELKKMQVSIQQIIDELLSNGQTHIPRLSIEMSIQRASIGTKAMSVKSSGPFFVCSTIADSKDIIGAFYFRLAHVLAATSEQIAKCPMAGRSRSCLILYLKRKNQTYCRQQCGSVARMQRKRTIDRKLLRKKRIRHGEKKRTR